MSLSRHVVQFMSPYPWDFHLSLNTKELNKLSKKYQILDCYQCVLSEEARK